MSLPTGPGNNPALAASPKQSIPSLKDEIDTRLATIANALVVFNEAAELDNTITNGLNSCNTAYSTIEAHVVSAADAFLHQSLAPRTAQSAAIYSRIQTAYRGATGAGHALEGFLPNYLYTIDLEMESNKDVISEWDKHPLPTSAPSYNRRSLAYQAAKAENIAYSNYKETIKAQVAKAQAVVTEMKKFNDDNKTQALVDKYNQVNASNFTFISDEVKVKSDEIKFDIKISALKQLPCDIPSKFSISETYKTSGGWKVDFSTGVFVNSGHHDFLGQEFQYVPNPTDDTKVVIKEKDGGQRVLLLVGALAHFYYRTGRFANVALSPGLSTTTALDGLNFHLGDSLLLGTKNRVILTGGVTFREVKILDKGYHTDQEYVKKSLPESVPTIKVFPIAGAFASITYNLTAFK
ncbi:hypothetical protein ACFQ48_18500 [Hymenobacter caeli]|uniref:Uncharacterized protein n=1 Tax=Hymenobacter caeli TaxID=2735894 RepID=A0ABX2FUS4_9BACT|nr:hypothetical protein [Hymenobacter caeli]NRT20938.1 hypothetical protein [Hymenobacter caeli]